MGTSLPPIGPGVTLLIVSIVGIASCWLIALLRFVTRRAIHALGLDDVLMLIGLLIWTITTGAIIGVGYHGAGRLLLEMPKPVVVIGIKYYFTAQLTYAACTIPIRCSICCTLLRIADTKAVYRYILYFIMALSAIAGFATMIAVTLACRPLQAFWGEVPGVCNYVITIKIGYFLSAVCIATDWALAVLPAFMLWNVRIKRSVKIYVIAILALGGLASCATMVRLRYLTKYGEPLKLLYNAAYICIWTVVEVGIGICAGSVGQLRPMLRQIPFFKRSSYASNSNQTSTNPSRSAAVTLNTLRTHKRNQGSEVVRCIHGRDELDLQSEADSQDERLHSPSVKSPSSLHAAEVEDELTIRRDFEVTVQPWIPDPNGSTVSLNENRRTTDFAFHKGGSCKTEVWYKDSRAGPIPRTKSFS